MSKSFTPAILNQLYDDFKMPVIVFPAIQMIIPLQLTPVINTTTLTAENGQPFTPAPILDPEGLPINRVTDYVEPVLTRLMRNKTLTTNDKQSSVDLSSQP